MTTKLEQLEKLGIIDDLMENNTIEQLSTMSAKSILGEWLEWEGIQGYTNKIVNIYETLRPKCAQEVIKELYEQNNIDGLWSVHLDDLTKEELEFEVEDWMYIYAMSLQSKETTR